MIERKEHRQGAPSNGGDNGKTYSKITISKIKSKQGRDPHEELDKEIDEMIYFKKQISWMENKLKEMSLPTTSPIQATNKKTGASISIRSGDLWTYYRTVLGFEHDSEEALYALCLASARTAIDENKTIGERLHAANWLGTATSWNSYYLNTQDKQRSNAKKDRKPILNQLILKLAKKPDTAKELWNELHSLLEDEFENVNESTSEFKYVYSHNDKIESITFKTFQNKLSSMRKSR